MLLVFNELQDWLFGQALAQSQGAMTRHTFAVEVLSSWAIAMAGTAVAQDQTPRPWRSVNDPAPAGVEAPPPPNSPSAGFDQGAAGQLPPNYQQGPGAQGQAAQQGPPPNYPQQGAGGGPAGNDNYGIPPRLTIPAGSFVSVRVNGWLSSDRNHQGDSFTATLNQPLVVDGIVVAQRGQTIAGRVTQAEKAGRVEGTSKLGVELTDLTLVDGSTVQVRSQMIDRNGPTSVGRDVGAIGATTALGAVIGAGVGLGRGAAIGAGAGAAAGIIGVLLTRGRPTVIYPESELTFRLDAPVMVATDRAPQAFRYAEQPDYQRDGGGGRPGYAARPGQAPYGAPGAYGGYGAYAAPVAPYPYYGGYGYGYPGYYGPGFGLYIGPGYGYYGRGFYGGYGRRR